MCVVIRVLKVLNSIVKKIIILLGFVLFGQKKLQNPELWNFFSLIS